MRAQQGISGGLSAAKRPGVKRKNVSFEDEKLIEKAYVEAQGDVQRTAQQSGWSEGTIRKWRRQHPRKASMVAKNSEHKTEQAMPVSVGSVARRQGEMAREFVLAFLNA